MVAHDDDPRRLGDRLLQRVVELWRVEVPGQQQRVEAGLRERVSIHPLAPIRFVRSSGLFYPMDDLLLEPGGLIGTSNEGTGGRVEIVPADDTPWLLILGKERLWDLMRA